MTDESDAGAGRHRAAAGLTVGDAIAVVEDAYPPRLAESWDAVGLVTGDPAAPLGRVLVTVDVTADVVAAAVASGAGLVLAHHPLLLRGVTSIAETGDKGRLLADLIRGGVALLTAHTNADSADPGVSDALAARLGLRDVVPLAPVPRSGLDKWGVYVPAEAADGVAATVFAAGAGAIGDYRECCWRTSGTGQFRPGVDANPAIGARGELEIVAEERIEFVAARSRRTAVLAALRGAHPYEEPAFDVVETAAEPGAEGLGRIGELAEPMSLREFVAHVAGRLPATPWGVRAAGDPERIVRRVAVCGGAGDSLVEAAERAGVDAYVTGDLRHHVVDESRRRGGPALVDAGHWATEFPWCEQAAELLRTHLPVDVAVFDVPTDPFGLHTAGSGSTMT